MRQIKQCISTHGGAGYAPGTTVTIYRYKDQPDINVRGEFTCGCGYKGEARPTGGYQHTYSFKENFWKALKSETKFVEPKWPDWMSKRYVYIERNVT